MSHHRSNRSSGKASAREAGNLEAELHMKLGVPVVLTQNISFEDGKLVDCLSFKSSNLIKFLLGRVCGAMGTVSEMHQPDGSVLVTLFRGTSEQRAFRKSTDDIVRLELERSQPRPQPALVRIPKWKAHISSFYAGNRRMIRTQLPLRLAFAQTDYKAQGSSRGRRATPVGFW